MSVAGVLKKVVRGVGVERRHVAPARMFCERYALAAFGRRHARRPGGRILAYHSVGQPEWGVNDVSPQNFRRHLDLALELGYRFVPASQIARTGGAPMDLAVTFDDGARSISAIAAPILRDYGVPYTVFPVIDWIDGKVEHFAGKVMSWDELGALMESGAEIGSHSVSHCDFGWITPDLYGDELAGSRRTIAARLGRAPESFAIPLGQARHWTAAAGEAARSAGYAIVYSQSEETRPAGTIARTFVTQFDSDFIFRVLLRGAFDWWDEWY
jgi:peptidoglycan/xylan/chitin deacetylase (PgdA/CDA1 family)